MRVRTKVPANPVARIYMRIVGTDVVSIVVQVVPFELIGRIAGRVDSGECDA